MSKISKYNNQPAFMGWLMVFILLLANTGCNMPTEPPPGSDDPGASQIMPLDPTIAISTSQNPANNSDSNLPLRPVRFINIGTVAATVMPWTYIPPYSSAPGTPANTSTVASPGGNSSAYLSLPLGTYTWCYWWELGDTNKDGLMEYAHALNGQQITLDENSPDDLDLAQSVTLSVPPFMGVMEGKCGATPTAKPVVPLAPSANGELIFSDSGSGAKAMFGSEYMDFAAQGGQGLLTANASNYVLPAMYGATTPANFILETTLSGCNADCCIIFRSDDVPDGLAYYNIIAINPGSRTISFSVFQGEWTTSTASVIENSAITFNHPVRVRLEVSGSQYVVYLDDLFAAQFQDGSITSGGIFGMSITTSSSPVSFAFSNVRVYALP